MFELIAKLEGETMRRHGYILVSQNTQENCDCKWIQSHCATLHGRVRYAGSLFTFHLRIQKFNHCVQKLGAVSSNVVSEPFVEVEIFSA
jgi:hypothetical protein